MKKILAVVLTALLIAGILPAVISAAEPEAYLYNVYADGMIFEQNSEAVFAGAGAPGAAVRAVLKDASGAVIAENSSRAGSDGTFTVSIPTPAGSFEEYSVALYEDGVLFRTLTGVVFGEVWLAAGQSNMSYPYAQAEDYTDPREGDEDLKQWIRLFFCWEIVPYKGDYNKVPAEGQNEIPDCCWFNAADQRAASFSAVSYFFAMDLAKTLDVPLGVVSVPLGGSSILAWLPREAVEQSPALTAQAKENGTYMTLEGWDEDAASDFTTMTAQYNKKISPIRNFRFSGMIWYQGESDISLRYDNGEYTEAFRLMQDHYSELFGCDGKLPIIWTELAAYYYFENESVTKMNAEFAAIQNERPDSRALVTAYDYAPVYGSAGAIHPAPKKPIGERMSFAAQRLVYGAAGDYTMPALASYAVGDGGVEVTLRNVGDGLVCGGDALRGFSIAGENGVYVRADAQITGENTVLISSPDVPEPKNAAYALAISNDRANLYASQDGERTLPAACFCTDWDALTRSWQSNAWTECEEAQSWHALNRSSYSAFYDTWQAKNAEISFSADAAYTGSAGMQIAGDGEFYVNPLLNVKPEKDRYVFSDLNTDWSDYGRLSLMVRNDGDAAATVSALIFTSPLMKYAPAIADGDSLSASVPADGKWHRIVFDLNRICLGGTPAGLLSDSSSLSGVTDVRFVFEGENASLSLDDVRFAPGDESEKREGSQRIIDFISWFLNFIRLIAEKLSIVFH